MTVKETGYDTITSLSSNNVMTLNGSSMEQITQANFIAGLNIPAFSGTNVTPASTSGTGETDLHTLTIPANTLSALNDIVIWKGSFTSTGGIVAGTNTLKLYIDGTLVSTLSMTSLSSAITVKGEFQLSILWSAANTIAFMAAFNGTRAAGTIYINFDNGTQAVTTSSNFDIKITGTDAQADGVTTCNASFLI